MIEHLTKDKNRRLHNVGLMLAQRLRRWASINPILTLLFMFAVLQKQSIKIRGTCHATQLLDPVITNVH